MEIGRWDRDYGSYRQSYEATYGHAIVESRYVSAADASMIYCQQGAGDWSDAATPDLVVSVQRTTMALTVGNESSQALARIFMRNRGITPTQWRRERRR